jgi:hypothetical protein
VIQQEVQRDKKSKKTEYFNIGQPRPTGPIPNVSGGKRPAPASAEEPARKRARIGPQIILEPPAPKRAKTAPKVVEEEPKRRPNQKGGRWNQERPNTRWMKAER